MFASTAHLSPLERDHFLPELAFAATCAEQLAHTPELYAICRARFERRYRAGLPLSARNTLCGVRDELLIHTTDHISPLFARLYLLENPAAVFKLQAGVVERLRAHLPGLFRELAVLAGVSDEALALLDAAADAPAPVPSQNATPPARQQAPVPHPRLDWGGA